MEEYQIYKFKDWIPLQFLCNEGLTNNPKAVRFLEENPERIFCPYCWSMNPNAIPFLEKNFDFIDWIHLAANPNGIHLIEKNFQYIMTEVLEKTDIKKKNFITHEQYHYGFNWIQKRFLESQTCPKRSFWTLLSLNPNAIFFLEKHVEHIHWNALMYNKNCLIIFEKYPEKINWRVTNVDSNYIILHEKFGSKISTIFWDRVSEDYIKKHWEGFITEVFSLEDQEKERLFWAQLSKNPNAISILRQNVDKINWAALSQNPNAISLLETHVEKIHWFQLCKNPNAMPIFLKYPEKITQSHYFKELCKNPNAHLLVSLFEDNLEHLDWRDLITNPFLVDFIKKHSERVDWTQIHCPKYFPPTWILETYREFIDLSKIPAHKFHSWSNFQGLSWMHISESPDIFELDKDALKMRMDIIRDELLASVFKPERIIQWKKMGYSLDTCI